VDVAPREGSGESLRVPDVLRSGNHAEIRRWRKREAVARTLETRPDLLDEASLDDEERTILRELVEARGRGKGAGHGRD
jgi:tRNA (guanine37-N1)-methyltransferase